jgi:hypothetical protein
MSPIGIFFHFRGTPAQNAVLNSEAWIHAEKLLTKKGRRAVKIGRNDPCHCGSGKKYKKCHERSDETSGREANEQWVVEINGRNVLCSKADMNDFDKERNLAMHEAAHAIAHWIMGHTIDYMQFNDDRTDINVHADKLAAITCGGGRLPDIMALPIGERTVVALQHAFVTLAGVFGSGDAASENPLRHQETVDHLFQAGSKLVHFLGMSKEEATEEVIRLIPVVTECFDDKAVWNTVNILATIFHKKRRLEGVEILDIINQTYSACKAAAAEGKVVALRVVEEA